MENLTQTEREAIQHWTAYGQRGKTPSHRVMPWEWCNKPFVKRISSPWHIKIEPDQLPLLLLGFLPRMAEHGLVDPRIFVVGEPVESHIFMSTSTRKDVSASEDKWFIYADGPNGNGEARVHFHRSWTGIKQIELVVDAGFDGCGSDGNGAAITTLIWESDLESKWKDADETKYMEVAREVCYWVLNVRLGPDILVHENLIARMLDADQKTLELEVKG